MSNTFKYQMTNTLNNYQDQEIIMSSTIFNQNSTNSPAEESSVDQPEIGGSSLSFCEICAERKEIDEMFTIESCSHVFCTDCINKHVSIKIQDKIHVVTCPDVCNSWDELLCESLILASQKFYCPYKDCSAMLVNDSDEIVRESECPVCWRLFCAQCHVPWHCGVQCEEFRKMNVDETSREDLMVKELAKAKQCLHMTCRCGSQFCYKCGITWRNNHAC
ncbi:hypothetical protein R3W88_017653 [Solanum pinnatisectum]|uniref:RBR-type E3 ubiquitin transferase n=1 Tax=Solanum pinnatisectum TaxID=50273 RepID=A0AAV9L408_9SOLN|nr:hypothetical protein R3W88_017653 [Solanum pinnatisectum]